NEDIQGLLLFFDKTFDARIWVFDRHGNNITTSTQDEVSVGKSVSPDIVEKVLKGEHVSNNLQIEGLAQPMISVAIPWGKEENLYGGIVMHSPVNGIDKAIGNVRETILWVT